MYVVCSINLRVDRGGGGGGTVVRIYAANNVALRKRSVCAVCNLCKMLLAMCNEGGGFLTDCRCRLANISARVRENGQRDTHRTGIIYFAFHGGGICCSLCRCRCDGLSVCNMMWCAKQVCHSIRVRVLLFIRMRNASDLTNPA